MGWGRWEARLRPSPALRHKRRKEPTSVRREGAVGMGDSIEDTEGLHPGTARRQGGVARTPTALGDEHGVLASGLRLSQPIFVRRPVAIYELLPALLA